MDMVYKGQSIMRIGISGAQGTGKTTLLNALRSEPMFASYFIGDEVTRRVKSYGLPINEGGTDVTQRLIMQEHIVNVFMHENLLTDRTSLDGLVYTTELCTKGKVKPQTREYAMQVFEKVQPMYDIQFFLEPEFDIENDGVRSTDKSFRDSIALGFKQTIARHNIAVYKLTGSVRNRLTQVFNVMEQINAK
jgi:nicotinamide riboside kinase